MCLTNKTRIPFTIQHSTDVKMLLHNMTKLEGSEGTTKQIDNYFYYIDCHQILSIPVWKAGKDFNCLELL